MRAPRRRRAFSRGRGLVERRGLGYAIPINRENGIVKTRHGWAGLVAALLVAGAARATDEVWTTLNEVQARLHDLGGQAIPAGEWNALLTRLGEIARTAEARNDGALAVRARLAEARAWGDMRRDPARGIETTRALRTAPPAGARPEDMRLVFVAEAEFLAARGQAEEIRRLMVEFKNSPWYDPRGFEYRGGEGREVPLVVRRPQAGQTESLTLLSMERQLQRARHATGTPFPPFRLADTDGRGWTSEHLAGRVYLVDVWVDGFQPWQRTLPSLEAAQRQFAGEGFLILGIPQNLDAEGVRAARARHPGLLWPQIVGPESRRLAARLGLFGDAGNFLVDRSGRIRGRNLSGQTLTDAIRALLAEGKE
jgi:hypothetical protein